MSSHINGHVRNGRYGPAAMRLLVARCEVLYTGRLTARLPEAVRLLMFKADGSFLVHDDAGGFRPLNCIRTEVRPAVVNSA
jgi:RecB family endonuclease NucS